MTRFRFIRSIDPESLARASEEGALVVFGDNLEGWGRWRTRCGEAPPMPAPSWDEARDRLDELIAGHVLSCVAYGESRDRIVMRCIRMDGVDPAAVLVREGLARDCPRYSEGFYGDE